jgi:hypothetical protein
MSRQNRRSLSWRKSIELRRIMDHHQLPNTGGGWWRVGRDDFQQLAQRILQFLAP